MLPMSVIIPLNGMFLFFLINQSPFYIYIYISSLCYLCLLGLLVGCLSLVVMHVDNQ